MKNMDCTDLHRHLKDTNFHELNIFKNSYEFVKIRV